MLSWPDSPAFVSHFCLNVRDQRGNQAEYLQGVGDGDDPNCFTASDESHTEAVLEGVMVALTDATDSTTWILHGASGGCVTAVSLARQLLAGGHSVLGVLADSGVPGSGLALPSQVPLSIWAYAYDKYW